MKDKIIKTALVNMFRNADSFNICTVDGCLKVAGTIADRETYDMLNALHCVKWRDMDDDVLKWIPNAIIQIFNRGNIRIEFNKEDLKIKTEDD